MDKIDKLLRSLSAKEQRAILLLMRQIKMDYRLIPGIQSLKGMKGWFRARMGRYRIIFTIDPKTGEAEIQRVTKRDEDTYKRLH